jgi:hypothetical protein
MSEEIPPRHAYDWMIREAMTVEAPKAGEHATLTVNITARARVAPSRGWGIAITVWGVSVLVLLATCHAHAQGWAGSAPPGSAWGQDAIGQQGWEQRNWGQDAVGSAWQDGQSCRVRVYQDRRVVTCRGR